MAADLSETLEARVDRLERSVDAIAETFPYVQALLLLVPALAAVVLEPDEMPVFAGEVLQAAGDDAAAKRAIMEVLGVDANGEPVQARH